MTVLPSLFLIFAIIHAASSQILPNQFSSKKSMLDWTKCETKKKCFCSGAQGLLKKVVGDVPREVDQLPAGADIACNIGVQSLFFSTQIALIQFQALDDELKPGNNPKLMLYQGDVELFGCKYDNSAKTVAIIGDKARIQRLRIDIFEERSLCEAGYCICSFKLERANRLRSITDDINLKQKTTIVKFTAHDPENTQTASTKDYAFDDNGVSLFDSIGYSCDPYAFKDLSGSTKYYVLPLKNRDLYVMNCKGYGATEDTYTMRYNTQSEQEVEILALKCDASTRKYHIVTEVDDGNGGKREKEDVVSDSSLYTFYCAAKADQLCEKPVTSCTGLCPEFTKGSKGRPATLTCPDKKWLIDGDYYVLDHDAECKRDAMSDRRELAFFVAPPSGPEKPAADAKCFQDFDCLKSAKLNFPDCEDIEQCVSIAYIEGVLKCADAGIDLIIALPESSVNKTVKRLSCDKSNGNWKSDGTGDIIAENSRVRCFKNVTMRDEAVVDLSTAQIVGIIGGSLLGMVVILVAISFCVRAVWKRKMKGKEFRKKMWLKEDKESRVKAIKETFELLMFRSPSTIIELKSGLRMIDLLLVTETEDPEAWEFVYIFLVKFKVALMKRDHNLWHMLSRYLYLKAKKIIDKHGWTCAKPINRKKPKGLMRVVAIRLLSYALSDPENAEADVLLRKGFRKLGFHAKSQYPHCGAMWTAIVHTSFAPLKSKKDASKIRNFNEVKFAGKLARIAMASKASWPKNPLKPLGTIAQQAAFALGNWTNMTYHGKHGEEYVTNTEVEGGKVSLSYFDGLIHSLALNPSEMILEAFKMTLRPNQKLADRLREEPFSDEFSMKMTLLMVRVISCGRHIDAKKLQTCLLPEVPQPNPILRQYITQQRFFERAIDTELEAVRAFFAAHTDKDEFKARPVYVASGKVQLDSRISTVDTRNDELGQAWPTKAKSNGRSGKATASASKSSSRKGAKKSPSQPRGAKPGHAPKARSAPRKG